MLVPYVLVADVLVPYVLVADVLVADVLVADVLVDGVLNNACTPPVLPDTRHPDTSQDCPPQRRDVVMFANWP
ncbi:MAG: hypothetical protein ACPGXK_03225 [Phycisphaerae bacterium]